MDDPSIVNLSGAEMLVLLLVAHGTGWVASLLWRTIWED